MFWPLPMNPAFRRILIETAETLAIALAGGVTFVFIGLPAGLVSGSVVAVATAALLGRPMRVPLTLARICYVVVGTLLGTVLTPETLRGVITCRLSVALLMLASLGMIAATMTYLRVVRRWDPLSALMGASPGGMAQVTGLSSELGGDLRAVAIVQTVRVLPPCRWPAQWARAVRFGRAGGTAAAWPGGIFGAGRNDPAARGRDYLCTYFPAPALS